MSSLADALDEIPQTDRRHLEEAFCLRIPDDCLRVAVACHFDAIDLWNQRNKYVFRLAENGLSTEAK